MTFSLGDLCKELVDIQAAYRISARAPHRRIPHRRARQKVCTGEFADSSLCLGDVAARAGVSKNHLSWEFARETGETLTEYISRVRIEEAKRLFSSTFLKVYEVAEKVGFENVEHFSRVFKKLAGASPRRMDRHMDSRTGDTVG